MCWWMRVWIASQPMCDNVDAKIATFVTNVLALEVREFVSCMLMKSNFGCVVHLFVVCFLCEWEIVCYKEWFVVLVFYESSWFVGCSHEWKMRWVSWNVVLLLHVSVRVAREMRRLEDSRLAGKARLSDCRMVSCEWCVGPCLDSL